MTAHFLVSPLPFSKKTPLHMNQNPVKVRSNTCAATVIWIFQLYYSVLSIPLRVEWFN